MLWEEGALVSRRCACEEGGAGHYILMVVYYFMEGSIL